jgi:hypothetical protein
MNDQLTFKQKDDPDTLRPHLTMGPLKMKKEESRGQGDALCLLLLALNMEGGAPG